MQNSVIIITGASSGIGRQIALDLAQQGKYDLILVGRNQQRLMDVVATIQQTTPTKAWPYRYDLSQAEQIDQFIEDIDSSFQRIDALIACAGYGQFKLAIEFTYQEMMAMFKVNTLGTMYLTTRLAQRMVDQGFGQITIIASVAGQMATMRSSVYSASKFAIIGYANSLRLELKRKGISVTVVNPGPVATPFFATSPELITYYQKVKRFLISPQYVSKKVIDNLCARKAKRDYPALLL
ncbi:SDR family NAD(P)-dependent oxidoreductase [Ignavigranum ruoffiae]|uniref:SDR family NAD(P)-dependent oxidoreductase n=1 Tax=Ignavigranum ruoffiae TaxID=89093 RepID=UPI0020593C32|nr:SDR family NAD(P)-dependent oxidoreductase [Ignavigranum ruoffiae]UPQ85659.1 SDR family NAD(P)-dependent oxidoreductase [Ignavigranum ruoffiae]